jgi:hypothetical protein
MIFLDNEISNWDIMELYTTCTKSIWIRRLLQNHEKFMPRLSKSYPHYKRLVIQENKVIHGVIHIIHNFNVSIVWLDKLSITKICFVSNDNLLVNSASYFILLLKVNCLITMKYVSQYVGNGENM